MAAGLRRDAMNWTSTQNRLSLDAAVDRRTIQRIEAGEVSAKIDTLYQIARALRTTLSELLEGMQ